MDTFVVRIWRPGAGSSPDPTLRGIVENVATGATSPFQSREALLSLLEQGLGKGDDVIVVGDSHEKAEPVGPAANS